jgi:hypothetical protein
VLSDTEAIALRLLHQRRLADLAAHRKQRLDALSGPFERDRVVTLQAAQRGVWWRVASRASVRRILRIERPERAHRRSELVVRFRHGVRDEPRELGHADKIELEPRSAGKEGAEPVHVLRGDRVARDPRVQERERERDLLGYPLGIQLPMGLREGGVDVFEDQRDEGL